MIPDNLDRFERHDAEQERQLQKLQRWVNNRIIFSKCKTFDEYKKTN